MRHKLDKMASTPHDRLLGYQQKKPTQVGKEFTGWFMELRKELEARLRAALGVETAVSSQ